jgi:hypothetical protein
MKFLRFLLSGERDQASILYDGNSFVERLGLGKAKDSLVTLWLLSKGFFFLRKTVRDLLNFIKLRGKKETKQLQTPAEGGNSIYFDAPIQKAWTHWKTQTLG